MLFVIHALDNDGMLDTRTQTFDAHKEYVAGADVQVVMSGPLVTDDGETVIGSLFLIEAADRAALDAFHHGDPFFKAGIWKEIHIQAFHRRVG